MLIDSLPVLDFYAIAYGDSPPLLRGRCRRELSAEEVTASCELLLDTALRHGCAHWLLDRCADPRRLPPVLFEWMQRDFFPRVRGALGRPVHLAFLVSPAECARLRQYDRPEDWHAPAVRLGWFSCETEARQWLHPDQR